MQKENYRFYIKVRTALDIPLTVIHDEFAWVFTDDDPHVLTEEMQETIGLSHGTIHRIISDHLKLKKLTARYVLKEANVYR